MWQGRRPETEHSGRAEADPLSAQARRRPRKRYAIGGGHVLHVVCDLTIASENAIFGQTGPHVGSFDAGFGSSYLARIIGQKKAGKCGSSAVSTQRRKPCRWACEQVVPLDKLEDEGVAGRAHDGNEPHGPAHDQGRP